jgi:hypothetical protein
VANTQFGNNVVAWGPSNLFKTDVTLLPIGTSMTTEGANKEWACNGVTEGWISFQTDQSYPVAAVYWSQRVGSGTGDNMNTLSIWSSDTTPFAAADPGSSTNPPSNVISLNLTSGNPVWTRYTLQTPITGRYFLLHLQKSGTGGNPGGSEFRLAVTVPGSPTATTSGGLPVITWPVYGDLQQANDVLGPWVPAVGVTNGVPFTPAGENRYFREIYQ